jgi:hypothetical protein
MKQNVSRDEACVAIAKLADISFERVRDIYQEKKAHLDALDEVFDKARKLVRASESDLPPASDS